MKIGLEIHVQLPTRSKMFCACPTDATTPNSAICPTCLGMPGARPSLNRGALEMGLRLAKLFDCKIPERTWFSRKTYFYPDLAKHFQVTQYENPVGEHGMFDFRGKPIRIRRVHLEEDPGRIKRVGRQGEEMSLVDYNRSGIPLVEIVTEPDLSNPAEARQFLSDMLTEIRHTIGLSDENEQSVRVDCNISVGVERVEVKNVTGLRNMERALKFEVVRQTKMLRSKKPVVRETRRFDEERKVTLPARKKEFEEDYGYIGEPDLGIYNIRALSESLVERETPLARAKRLCEDYGINEGASRQLINTSMDLCDLFEDMAEAAGTKVSLYLVTDVISSNWSRIKDVLDKEMRKKIIEVAKQYSEGTVNDLEARRRLRGLFSDDEVDDDISVPRGDPGILEEAVEKAVTANPGIFDDYAKNERAANRLIGEVINSTNGAFSSQEIVLKVRERLERGP